MEHYFVLIENGLGRKRSTLLSGGHADKVFERAEAWALRVTQQYGNQWVIIKFEKVA
jgi:hypothetical protein